MAATPRKLRLCKGSQIFLSGKNLDINKQATIDCLKEKKKKRVLHTQELGGDEEDTGKQCQFSLRNPCNGS